ncbi:MAG: GAF domain-containing protein [Lachnospiraceae bacterium]|nr:GAF domain-containing protein [Lachnospiraceae bacterium]
MGVNYGLMKEQISAFAETDPWYLPLLSNAAAVLYHALPEINWAGFYLLHQGRLVLGPFQGKPACIHIAPGRGVCGTAVQERRALRVADVHQFPGHIACDSASRSEIVLPLEKDGEIFGVLDIDSPVPDRFSEEDEEGLKETARRISELIVMEETVSGAV